MILGQDYKFRDDMKYDTVPIELLTGPYKGVILRYTQVAIKEQENESARMMFDYDLYKTGDFSELTLRRDVVFTNHIGLVLNSLILESLEGTNESGKNDTEELVEESELHEEGDTIPEK